MNLPIFLARRVRHAPNGSFSATVTRVGIISIAVGLTVMIIAFAVLFGFKRTIQQKIFVFGAHMQVSKFTLNQSYEEPPIPRQTPLYTSATRLPNVRHIQGVAVKAGILKTPDELAGAILKGVGPDYDWQLVRESLVAGTIPDVVSDTVSAGYSTQILISQSMADGLRLGVGQSVLMYFIDGQSDTPPRARKMIVAGIYLTGLEEGDNNFVLGDLRLVQRLNGWGRDSVGSYELFVNDFARLDETAARVFDVMSPDQRLFKVTDQYRPLFDWMKLLDTNTVVLLVIILFVASFNIISVLLVLMIERTPMIGLLKALGGADSLLRRTFLYVGLNMVAWGLLIGNAVGIGLCWVQDRFRPIPLDPKSYFMSFVPIEWDWPVILLLNVATVAIIALVLWLPTLVISRIQPVRALVFKK